MAKVKVKKKSTLIDMTAMSDVTVLLLTFFMLTSTFVQKEPVQVSTPSSVSEIKIPEINVLQVLIEPSGKIFISLDKQEDRVNVLNAMSSMYGRRFYQGLNLLFLYLGLGQLRHFYYGRNLFFSFTNLERIHNIRERKGKSYNTDNTYGGPCVTLRRIYPQQVCAECFVFPDKN